MRGVFGLLLIGGGVILVYGLFTGKITFPGGAAIPLDTAQQQASQKPGDVGSAGRIILKGIGAPSGSNVYTDGNGNCPSGYEKTFDSSGLPYCVPHK